MNDDCPVCMEPLAARLAARLPCSTQHILCMGCFLHLRTKVCPLCRSSFEHALPSIDLATRQNLIDFLRAMDDDETHADHPPAAP